MILQDILLSNTDIIPISLGWNCNPALYRANNLNYKKGNGYLTCPFDLCVSPFIGLCKCLYDEFDNNGSPMPILGNDYMYLLITN
jgi:hypothetical protein